MSNNIYVAKIGKAVGLKGEVKLHTDTDFPEQFKKGSVFTTKTNQELTIESYNHNRKVVKFVGFDDCEVIKKLINKELFTNEELTRKSCNLEEDQYFWFDLIGLELIEDETNLGKIKDIHRLPASDYFEIITSEELQKKDLPKSFMVPYTPNYIVNVDIPNKQIQTQNCFDILENS
jgi:16S rRNA processing protein RimM